MHIHIAIQGRKEGPFTLDDLNQKIRSGSLAPANVLAWYEGAPGWVPLSQVPGIDAPASPPPLPTGAPPLPVPPPRSATESDATGGVIPYKNAPALISYYLAVFSLIPCLGFLLGIAAVIMGILGLKKQKQNPAVKGTVHAWVGIILGGFIVLAHLTVVIILLAQK